MSEFITEEELCEWLKISQNTAYRWRKNGMPYLRIERSIRYDKDKVKEWIQKNSLEKK